MNLDAIAEEHDLRIFYETTPIPTKWRASNDSYYTGMTFALIKVENWYYLGVSRCSKRDGFDKKMARIIAVGRAISAYTINKKGVIKLPNERISMLKTTYNLLGMNVGNPLPARLQLLCK